MPKKSKKLHDYEVELAATSPKYERKYAGEYGFGFNMPAIIEAKNLKEAKKIASKRKPKGSRVVSVKRVWWPKSMRR